MGGFFSSSFEKGLGSSYKLLFAVSLDSFFFPLSYTEKKIDIRKEEASVVARYIIFLW